MLDILRGELEFNPLYIEYIMIEVTDLSIMLGSCPPGKVVVKAPKIPATIPVIIAILKFFVIVMDKIINASNKSGFIPKTIPGVI